MQGQLEQLVAQLNRTTDSAQTPSMHMTKADLDAYVAGRLSDDFALKCEAHLESCPDCCQAALDRFDESSAAASDFARSDPKIRAEIMKIVEATRRVLEDRRSWDDAEALEKAIREKLRISGWLEAIARAFRAFNTVWAKEARTRQSSLLELLPKFARSGDKDSGSPRGNEGPLSVWSWASEGDQATPALPFLKVTVLSEPKTFDILFEIKLRDALPERIQLVLDSDRAQFVHDLPPSANHALIRVPFHQVGDWRKFRLELTSNESANKGGT